MKPLRTWLLCSALLGLVAPAVWFTPRDADGLPFWTLRILSRLWPSSFWLLATDGAEDTPQAKVIIGMAVLANVLLYSFIGGLAWCIATLVRRRVAGRCVCFVPLGFGLAVTANVVLYGIAGGCAWVVAMPIRRRHATGERGL